MIMTNVAFIHHFYLDLFTSTIPKKVEDFIIENTNGEDIAMNVLIGKYLTEVGHPQPVGIKMNSKKLDIGNLSSMFVDFFYVFSIILMLVHCTLKCTHT